MQDFTHLDKANLPAMVDVSEKKDSLRTAIAQGIVILPEEIMQKFTDNDIQTKKGSVFQTAIIAGIMAAKKTGELIPLCHPLGLENCSINILLEEENKLLITCTASITAKTGVEMEALVGVSMAALTIYDMCKSMSHEIVITDIRLLKKTGGKNDFAGR